MVKKIIVILVTCILAGSLLSGCSNQEETTLFVGEYEIEETTAIIPPYVKIEKDNRFVFQYSTFSSYLPMGNYTLDNNVLTLVTDDQKYHYVFHISDDKLIFQEEQSSSLTVYADEPNIVNGAVFTYRRDN